MYSHISYPLNFVIILPFIADVFKLSDLTEQNSSGMPINELCLRVYLMSRCHIKVIKNA